MDHSSYCNGRTLPFVKKNLGEPIYCSYNGLLVLANTAGSHFKDNRNAYWICVPWALSHGIRVNGLPGSREPNRAFQLILRDPLTLLCFSKLKSTAYRSGHIDRPKWFSIILRVRLYKYVAELLRDWEISGQRLSYLYNTQIHGSTVTNSFILLLLTHLAGLKTFTCPSSLAMHAKHGTASSILDSRPASPSRFDARKTKQEGNYGAY